MKHLPPIRANTQQPFMATVLPARLHRLLPDAEDHRLEDRILEYLHDRPMATRKALRKALGCGRHALDDELKRLQLKGTIESKSIGPHDRYFLSRSRE